MNDELVTIATFDNTVQANLVRNQLAAAGIRATLVDEHTVGLNWALSNAIGGVKLIVREEDYEDAAHILADPAAGEERDEAGQAYFDSNDGDDEDSGDDVENAAADDAEVPDKATVAPTRREEDAERAFRAACMGIILMPLQLYAAWLLIGVWLSHERLGPTYRRQAWQALAICVPILFAWLLALKYWFWSGLYFEF